ncbi:DddA-like double-stranded DNA deaminase toxin [Streptomyces sp. NPDC086023]|uniref:DddA-like double-stranded DNA deaminase toxin n=1 Tax=Streptomyces sp. NPDC086023 TaxID=3365746 RepID=UPI0037D15DCA
MAKRKDDLTANHRAEIARLVSIGQTVAAQAQRDRWLAVEAALKAKNAATEAKDAAEKAKASAAEAAGHAAAADRSADAAEQSASEARKSAATARTAADQADQDANAAADSAAEAEFSAGYARQSASEANASAEQARASALAAGKSREQAEAMAKKAWATVATKREAEIAEARRQAAEERKRQQAKQPKRVCIPHPTRETMAPIMACVGSPGDSVIQMPQVDPALEALIWEVSGLNDIKKCVTEPTLAQCMMAGIGILPVGKLKLADKALDGIQALIESRKFTRSVGCLVGAAAHSFPAGTKVLMADGSHRPIEQIQVGDLVTTTDPVTGESGPRPVTRTITTPDDRDFTDVTLSDGSELTSTDHHPYWVENRKRWIDAVDLRTGDALRTPVGTAVQVGKTSHWTGLQPAYDLTVDDLHTYYVNTGTTDVLVHNTDTTCPAWVVQIQNALPKWFEGDKTVGQLRGADGKVLSSLPDSLREVRSGEVLADGSADPWYVKANKMIYTSDHPGFKKPRVEPKYPPSSHVEAKYAAWMAENKISTATVVINNSQGVCRKALNCYGAIEAILPDGHTLNVYYPGAAKAVPLVGKRKVPLP